MWCTPSWTTGSRWRRANPPHWKETSDVRLDLAQPSRADGGACAVGTDSHPGRGRGAVPVGVPRTGASDPLQRTDRGRFLVSLSNPHVGTATEQRSEERRVGKEGTG